MGNANSIQRDGFQMIRAVFSAAECSRILSNLDAALSRIADPGVLKSASGAIYGARNLLQIWPGASQLCIQPRLIDFLASVLGADFGLVRALYFDKPPENSWALPWHRDMAIAVENNQICSSRFRNPTRKSGVPHVDAPTEILERMVTLRIHLDEVTDENGPLKIMVGSHQYRDGNGFSGEIATILAQPGDVLAMRPLVSHCSDRSMDGCTRHRRIMHLEFSGIAMLPDGFRWFQYLPFR